MSQHILIAGLPESGKSTFLGALWYVVRNPDSCPGSLALEVLGGDKQYLNELSRLWLKCEDLHRTNPTTNADDLLGLQAADGASFSIRMPDHRGENFLKLWTDRQWQDEFTEAADEALGMLLFVRGDDIEQPVRVPVIPQGAGVANTDESEEVEAAPFDSAKAPTQVVLVDLLQLALRVRNGEALPVGVVITARDALPDAERELPVREFLARELPLLAQYLESNPQEHPHRLWSISAQGGDYARDAQQLTDKPEAATRIDVVDEDGVESHDITEPVKWLLGTRDV